MIGKTISHYAILELIGGGGMGVVYKAEDTKLKRPVALKFLPPAFSTDPMVKERFVHEAQAASALQHNNICGIHAIDETDDGQMYIVMDYYEGETLKDRISTPPHPPLAKGGRERGVSIDDAITIAIQIAKGLAKAHQKDIVHRDIKPANIMVTNDGDIKILDFGLAKVAAQTKLTKSGTTVGTVAYMSPEQSKGEVIDHRSDIWSLGVILYEMISGELPFKGDYDQALVYSILNEKPQMTDDIPSELNDIIEKSLAKDPDERYQEMEQVISDLKVIRGESDSSQQIISKRKKARGKRPRNLSRSAIFAVMLVVLLLSGYFIGQEILGVEIEPIPIAVTSFENQTGDSSNDYLQKAIPILLISDLEQSKYFHVNTWGRMKDLLEQSGREDMEYIDEDMGIQLCKIDNIPFLAAGSFTKVGDSISIDVKIMNTNTRTVLKTARSAGKGENSLLNSQIDELSEQIAKAVKLDEEEFIKSKKPFSEVTTNSIEAYKYYLLGIENSRVGNVKEARDHLTKALLLDSTFAMAHLHLAVTSGNMGSDRNENQHMELAKKYRHKVTHKEQIHIDHKYDDFKGNNISNSIRALEEAIPLYPKEKGIFWTLGQYYKHWKGDANNAIANYERVLDLDPNHGAALNMIAYAYMSIEEYTKALEYFRRYADVAPDQANPYDSMGEVHLELNDYAKSIEMYQKALEIEPTFWPSYRGIVLNYIKMRDFHKARNYLNLWSNLKSPDIGREDIHEFLATAYMADGDTANTLDELENLANLRRQQAKTYQISLDQFNIPEILYEHGMIKEAEEKMAEVKKLMESSELSEFDKGNLRGGYFWHATRIALKKGDLDQAREYADIYKNVTGRNKIPYMLSGLIAYAEGNFDKAISDLNKPGMDNHFSNYHLALAYIKSGDEKKAIEKLRRVLNYNIEVDPLYEMIRSRAEKHLSSLKVLH